MKRAWLIYLSFIVLVSGGAVYAQEDGFYVIPVMKSNNYAPVPKTGQTQLYQWGDDGDLKKGVAWPIPRFTDNNNGTVTDNLTGLIWTKDPNAYGYKTWLDALNFASNLEDGKAGLTDGSRRGDWRLPNVRELQSLIDYGKTNKALPEGHPFGTAVQSYYWSSTSYSSSNAWYVEFSAGSVTYYNKGNSRYVWCVRGGP